MNDLTDFANSLIEKESLISSIKEGVNLTPSLKGEVITIKSKILKVVKENPLIKASKVNYLIRHEIESTSAYLLKLVKLGLIKRSKNDEDVYVYFIEP